MNILKNIKPPLNGEDFTTLLNHKNIKIVRIISSDKLDIVEYIQEEDEWVLIIEGEATIIMNNQKYNLIKGDTLFIPSKTKHIIENVKSATIWLAIHIF
ncbi:Uncharacterized conserved protein [hydrothermal vent metagenome]|uniref:Uncharacterized conserved protein n=1 Tax=hydrothermal vent metagenome TaxID=652676 RepID=A0A1W1EIN1_9ZZZZ